MGAGFFYGSLVLALFWEAATHLSTSAIAGSQVGGLFIWEFWWFKESLFDLGHFNPLFTHAIMFPAGVPILIQTPLLIAMSLVLQCAFSVYASYNILTLAALSSSGLGMYILVYRLTKSKGATLLSGFIFTLSHYNLTEIVLGHLNLKNA